jgi:hypothetical protein
VRASREGGGGVCVLQQKAGSRVVTGVTLGPARDAVTQNAALCVLKNPRTLCLLISFFARRMLSGGAQPQAATALYLPVINLFQCTFAPLRVQKQSSFSTLHG